LVIKEKTPKKLAKHNFKTKLEKIKLINPTSPSNHDKKQSLHKLSLLGISLTYSINPITTKPSIEPSSSAQ